MVTLEDLRQKYREDILKLAEKYGAYEVRVFGSVARGQATPNSDIDFLVEFREGQSLLSRIGLIQDLEKLLGCKVDVAKPQNLHSLIKDKVIQEAVFL